MAMKVGDKVYLFVHAYYHILGEVTEILGVRRVALRNASLIWSCRRDWEQFFRDGCKNDTTSHYVGDVTDVGYFMACAWHHELLKLKRKA